VAGLLLCAAVRAQAQHHGGGPGGGGGMRGEMGGGAMGGDGMHGRMGGDDMRGDLGRPEMRGRESVAPARSGPLLAPPGLWWEDNRTVKKLSLRPEQKQRMDDIFNANKGPLLNGFANLQREESRLNALSPQDLQDETTVFAAIDRVSQARAGLAKEIAHYQLQLRQQLTPAQLKELDKEVASLH
jgi:Spy/CpxP family protein refolding chaperone